MLRRAAVAWSFLARHKAWWVIPLVAVLVLVAVLMATTPREEPRVVPFIYTTGQ